jgi:hypothetical protein
MKEGKDKTFASFLHQSGLPPVGVRHVEKASLQMIARISAYVSSETAI